MGKVSKDFGQKEFLLNYTNRRWGLTKTTKVGTVMALIRENQPQSYDDWKSFYFNKAHTNTKTPIKVTEEILRELGERLYGKLKEIVIPDLLIAIKTITEEDCIDYIYELTLSRTYDGYITEKSIVNNSLSKKITNVKFVESDPELDHSGDIDFLGWIDDKNAIGIQVKPVTANANLGNYSITARMEQSFRNFTEQYNGRVFVVFSVDDRIANENVINEIEAEVTRLKAKG
jgi:hypothetical protein